MPSEIVPSTSSPSASTSASRRASLSPRADLNEALHVPLSTRSFAPQFASLYHFRLRKLKGAKRDEQAGLLRRARERWGDGQLMRTGNAMRTGTGVGSKRSSTEDQGDEQAREQAREQQDEDEGMEMEGVQEGTDCGSGGSKRPAKVEYAQRILDIEQGRLVAVCGIVYCSMRLKPDVLEDLTREQYLPPIPARTTYADSATDEIFLEDESGRIRLVGNPQAVAAAEEEEEEPSASSAPQIRPSWRRSLVTGVVCAVLGTETRAGDFDVVDVVFPGIPDALHASSAVKMEAMDVDAGAGADANSQDGQDEWIALASGLEVGDEKPFDMKEDADQPEAQQEDGLGQLRVELLSEWLRGEAPLGINAGVRPRNISALILAGNSCAVPSALRTVENKAGRPRAFDTNPLDCFLASLTSSIQVQILPGAKDPAGLALPQQPLHKALFPRSAAAGSNALIRSTNPAWSALGDSVILGTSGQNIDDLFKYVEGGTDEDRLRMACNTLRWGHLAPSAPDTLCCYPFTDRDPFLISQRPRIYFIGNQPRFATALFEPQAEAAAGAEERGVGSRGKVADGEGGTTRVLLLPSFKRTGTLVLVNKKSLQVKLLHILPTSLAEPKPEPVERE